MRSAPEGQSVVTIWRCRNDGAIVGIDTAGSSP
jgi:hypothetical protein